MNPGDGAFYGPKIDITIRDALRRSFQCATIQLDFQLPERFNLRYRSADEAAMVRPVIIHRAILGSLERFIAIITEHFAGKWYLKISILCQELWSLIMIIFTQAFLDIPSASSSDSSRGSLCELDSYLQKTFFVYLFFLGEAMLIFIFRLTERIRSGNN